MGKPRHLAEKNRHYMYFFFFLNPTTLWKRKQQTWSKRDSSAFNHGSHADSFRLLWSRKSRRWKQVWPSPVSETLEKWIADVSGKLWAALLDPRHSNNCSRIKEQKTQLSCYSCKLLEAERENIKCGLQELEQKQAEVSGGFNGRILHALGEMWVDATTGQQI